MIEAAEMFLETLMIVARTVAGEARGEDRIGKKAVAHVIFNRVNGGFHGGLTAAVCLSPKQFSCWNRGDPNRERIVGMELSDPVFRECIIAVLEAMDEDDFTKGADHYCAKSITPDWAVGKTPCYEHGGHKFFNNID